MEQVNSNVKTVFARDCGVLPDSGEDGTASLAAMLVAHPDGTTFHFERGRYCFQAQNAHRRSWYMSNSNWQEQHFAAILLENRRGITLDFQGSQLLFSGDLSPFALDSCQDITLKNAVVDWTIPLSAEGQVAESGEERIVVQIDPTAYPHRVEKGVLTFMGEDWAAPLDGAMEFDREAPYVRAGAGDTFPPVRAELLAPGLVALFGSFSVPPLVGNTLVLRHTLRVHPGLFCQNSKNVRCEKLTFHNTGGLGALFQFTEDITVTGTDFVPNGQRGRRVLSGHDDGLQFSNCRGTVQVSGCRFSGLMDDPINVHGTSVRITSLDGCLLTGAFVHPQSLGFDSWAAPGDVLSLIHRETLNSPGQAVVKEYRLLTPTTFALTLTQPVPAGIAPGDALENLTNTPQFFCRDNYFGSCRARGLLVTTPRKVVIERNVFESSGTAVLLSGDANAWYESGACKDVTIRENLFTGHCFSSIYQFCNGVISLHPEIPNRAGSRGFHENVMITGNTFLMNQGPLLYAHCTKNLQFTGNRVFPMPGTRKDAALTKTQDCTEVTIEGNVVMGE